MPARTIPDGAAVTNHFTGSFPPYVEEGAFISISGIADESEVIDGPDSRGYSTGKKTRQTLTVVVPMHTDLSAAMYQWKSDTANGKAGHAVTGTVTVADAADTPKAIFELANCMCYSMSSSDMSLDGAEMGQETFMISYAGVERIGP